MEIFFMNVTKSIKCNFLHVVPPFGKYFMTLSGGSGSNRAIIFCSISEEQDASDFNYSSKCSCARLAYTELCSSFDSLHNIVRLLY